ncbi:N-acetyltransferase [Actinomyces ruminicola]|uniref:N-acetyltransferase n=1 Tax=Actinomyces ruminicola TaxID=332524 RepID=UPI00115FEB98|nr:N-acetyltransferase [Actinomyces ruminicola]
MSEEVRQLTAGDLASNEMHTLMRAAAGLPEAEIRRILAEELPGMVVLGTGGVGHPSSVAACVVHRDRVLLEYLAVSAASRGRGIGGRLVRQVARLGSPVVRDRRQRRVAVGRAARMIRCDDSRLVATIRQVAPTIRYELRRFAG